ncbi:HNH endonuclease [archaeon]|nr:HNH endonuclease [archaeon]
MQNFKINIELVPKTCWFSNVRSQVSKTDWDTLRKTAYSKANHKCEVCGTKRRLEAHEIWHYDDKALIQKLFGLTAVCKSCHELYHLGYTSTRGNFHNALKWLSQLNSWDMLTTKEYVDIVFEIWFQRSNKEWILDLSFLDNKNIKYSNISPSDRVSFSKNSLVNK